ncbi:hypothetical protein B0T24DRAFT_587407 [Lasiosphaeria ovina]|uniref:Uncharacterized protein n=1 Tax=Lasiosphaeria ovina TaxID=92902 RepID=A0AAE0NJL3_9PEZI|nr:hypothetical protein B0T24DRAFT_587407 [Lasiosphaeria ovina]
MSVEEAEDSCGDDADSEPKETAIPAATSQSDSKSRDKDSKSGGKSRKNKQKKKLREGVVSTVFFRWVSDTDHSPCGVRYVMHREPETRPLRPYFSTLSHRQPTIAVKHLTTKRSLPSSQLPRRDGSGADFQDVADQMAATINNSDRFIGSNLDFEWARRNNGGASSRGVLESMPANLAGAGEFINTEPTYYPRAIPKADGAHPSGKDLQRDNQLALPNDGGVPAQGEPISVSPILDDDEALMDPQPNNAPARPNQHEIIYEDVPDLDHFAESDTTSELHEIEGPEYDVAIQPDEVVASGQDFYDQDMSQEFSGAPPPQTWEGDYNHFQEAPKALENANSHGPQFQGAPQVHDERQFAHEGQFQVEPRFKQYRFAHQSAIPEPLALQHRVAYNESLRMHQNNPPPALAPQARYTPRDQSSIPASLRVGNQQINAYRRLLPNYKANWEEPVLCHKEVNRVISFRRAVKDIRADRHCQIFPPWEVCLLGERLRDGMLTGNHLRMSNQQFKQSRSLLRRQQNTTRCTNASKAREGRDHCGNRIHDSASEIIRSNEDAKAPGDEKGLEDEKYHDAEKKEQEKQRKIEAKSEQQEYKKQQKEAKMKAQEAEKQWKTANNQANERERGQEKAKQDILQRTSKSKAKNNDKVLGEVQNAYTN